MTVKTFTDLTGMKEANIAELETIGIKTVEELAAAVNDDAKAKEVIKVAYEVRNGKKVRVSKKTGNVID